MVGNFIFLVDLEVINFGINVVVLYWDYDIVVEKVIV